MKESYSEDLASHTGPESCEPIGNARLEALTGEPAGRAIEPRNQDQLRGADALMAGGRPHRAERNGENRSALARSKNQGMQGSLPRGNREIPRLAPLDGSGSPRRESQGNETTMNGRGKSDRPIISERSPNKVNAGAGMEEAAERRGLAKGNPQEQTNLRAQYRIRLQHALTRIRQAVRREKGSRHPYPEHRLCVSTYGRSPVR